MRKAFTPIELPVDPGENKALIDAFITRYQSCYDDMLASDLTRQLAKHIKSEGESMLQTVMWETCEPYFVSNMKVDQNKKEEVAQKINGTTRARAFRLTMQVYPEMWACSTEPLDQDRAALYDPECNLYNGEYNLESVVCKWLDDVSAPRAQFHSELLARNQYFLGALKDACSKGFYLRRELRNGWDEGKEMCVSLPDYCKYSTVEDYISSEDLCRIVGVIKTNSLMLDCAETPVMLLSPYAAAKMVNGRRSPCMIDFRTSFYSAAGAPKDNPMWIDFFQDPCVPDNKAYVLIPNCTVGFFDWGTRTEMEAPRILPDNPKRRKMYEEFGMHDDPTLKFRRVHQTKTCVIEPRAFMEITIK